MSKIINNTTHSIAALNEKETLDKNVKQTFDNLNDRFKEFDFDDIVLTEEQEQQILDLFNSPSFDENLSSDLNQLNLIESKFIEMLQSNSRLTKSSRANIVFNLVKVQLATNNLNKLKDFKQALQYSSPNNNSLNRKIQFSSAYKSILNLKQDELKNGAQKINTMDNIKDSEQSYVHFFESNSNTNSRKRITIDEKFLNIQENLNIILKDIKSDQDVLFDDNRMAHIINRLKERALSRNEDILTELEECEEILKIYQNVQSLTESDNKVIEIFTNLRTQLSEALSKNNKFVKDFDRQFRLHKRDYGLVLRAEAERKLNNLDIDALLHTKPNEKPIDDIPHLFERFLIMSEVLIKYNWSDFLRREYSLKSQRVKTKLQSKLEKEAETQENTSSFNIDYEQLENYSESDKKSLSSSPLTISQLVEVLSSGEYQNEQENIKLGSEERYNLYEFLKELNEYRLENQGLIKINISKNSLGNTVKSVSGQRHGINGVSNVTTIRISTTQKVYKPYSKLKSNGENKKDNEELQYE